MKKLTIHFFVQAVHEQGTYFRFHNLAVGLTNLGHNVTIFGSDNLPNSKERQEIRDGVVYHISPGSKGMSLFGAATHPLTAIRRCLVNYPPCDVAHLFQPFSSAALPWLLSRKKRARAVFYDWDDLWMGGIITQKEGSFLHGFTRLQVDFLEKRLPGIADYVTTCSRFLADMALERGALNTSVIYNGLWPFETPNKLLARQMLGLREEATYVGFMGQPIREIEWCFEALTQNLDTYPNLRFALCGPPETTLSSVPPSTRVRIDYLGVLPSKETRIFSSALDLGLLPLGDSLFNQSRFPIKYCEYMSAGSPVLCSTVGECGQLAKNMPWVLEAGKTREDWLRAFQTAMAKLHSEEFPVVDLEKVRQLFSWNLLSQSLLETYIHALTRYA